MNERNEEIAVVGGGPAGCTAAWRLHRAGFRVTLYEAEDWIGGRTRTDDLDGFRIDSGAQLFGSMFTRFNLLARELGMAEELIHSRGRDALWRDGRAYEVVYGSVASMLASGGLPWRTRMCLGTTYVPFLQRHTDVLDLHAPELAAAGGLDRESIAVWGEREMDRDFVEHLVYPQLSAYYGALPEETSAGLYHTLARHGVDVSVHGFRRGAASLYERIVERLRAAGGEVTTGTAVAAVAVDPAGVTVEVEGTARRFDGAVLATPAPVSAALLREGASELREWLAAVPYRPSVTLGLMLDRPVGARFFGLSFARSAAREVVAACVEENKVPGLVPDGRGLIVAFARPDRAPALVEQEPGRILDAMLPDLEQAWPGLGARITRARLYRWRVGNPVFEPGSLARLGEFRRGRVEGGGRVAVAGDYLYVSSVEGAVVAGERAAETLATHLSRA